MRLELGGVFDDDRAIPLSGLRGDAFEVRAALAVGLADGVEARLENVGWQHMDVAALDSTAPGAEPVDIDGGGTSDALDATLAGRVRLGDAGPLRTAVQVAMTLPNAGNESGLGRDVTDVAASVLGGWRGGAFTVAAEAGVAILGTPTVEAEQDDQGRLGLAVEMALGTAALAAEVRTGFGDESPGNEIVTRVAGGARLRLGRVWLDAAYRGAVGERDDGAGIEAGITTSF